MSSVPKFIICIGLFAAQAAAASPPGASVRILAPKGATIIVDGRLVGTAGGAGPFDLHLKSGNHHIIVKLGKAVLESTRVNLLDGADLVIELPKDGRRS